MKSACCVQPLDKNVANKIGADVQIKIYERKNKLLEADDPLLFLPAQSRKSFRAELKQVFKYFTFHHQHQLKPINIVSPHAPLQCYLIN